MTDTAAPDWRPIESAPKDGTQVILWWPYWRNDPIVGFYDTEYQRWSNSVALTDVGESHEERVIRHHEQQLRCAEAHGVDQGRAGEEAAGRAREREGEGPHRAVETELGDDEAIAGVADLSHLADAGRAQANEGRRAGATGARDGYALGADVRCRREQGAKRQQHRRESQH